MNRLLNRRTLLRGAGVALALPWLESLAPKVARGQAMTYPKRFIPIFFPNGSATFWRPATPGAGDAWKLSPILDPFAPLKKKFTVLTNVENYSPAQANDPDIEPSHGRDPGVFLSCVDAKLVRDQLKSKDANGTTADQIIAQHPNYATQTALASLQVGLSTIESYCDGQPCSLSRSISWKSPTEPLYKEMDPLKVFDAITGAAAPVGGGMPDMPDPEREKQRQLNKSILDAVLENANRTRGTLGTGDQARMDQFLQSVRDTEKAATVVSGGMAKAGTSCNTVSAPTLKAGYGMANAGGGYNKGAHMDVMNDLIVMALTCDATRIISYMLEDERSEFVYDHVPKRAFSATGSAAATGTCGNYHGAQHGGDANNDFATINWWQSTKIAELATKMDAIKEGDGTLLDNSIMVYASCMHGGNHHADDLPVALIGGGGGVFKMNQNVQFAAERPLRDVYFTILNSYFDLGVDSFGINLKGAPNKLISEILV
jgi:Protein of unknown function (DUF1552)